MKWAFVWREVHRRGYVLVRRERYEGVRVLNNMLDNLRSHVEHLARVTDGVRDQIRVKDAEIAALKRSLDLLADRVVAAEQEAS